MIALAPVRGFTVKSAPRLECETISVLPSGATAIPFRFGVPPDPERSAAGPVTVNVRADPPGYTGIR